MQRYFAKDSKLNLHDSDYHHIKNVMRMKTGDLIKVLYDNVIYTCKLNISKEVTFDVIKQEEMKNKTYKIISAFALLKEQKLDYLFQKGCEVGIDTFIPVIMNRSIIKYDLKKDSNKKERWNKILKEASEQSFRCDIPKICDVSKFEDLINIDADIKLLCSLNENTKNIKKVLEKTNKCDKILLVTGPEGGFTKEEEKYLIDNGFISVSLGNNILRSETAPIVCASFINYEFMR